MAIRCITKDVVLAGKGKLQLPSSWTSHQSAGEFARFEVRLSTGGVFRFRVGGAQTFVVKATRRKVTDATAVEISAAYVNLDPGPNNRMARFTFCAISKDASGADVEVESKMVKFLP